MEYAIFAACLTVIVGLVLYAYHTTQEKTTAQLAVSYKNSCDFQQAVLTEIRLIRSQEQVERAQMAAERTNVMGTVNHLIAELRRDNALQDEKVRVLLERLRLELVQCVGDAAAHVMGQVKGEPVSVMEMGGKEGVESTSLEDGEDCSLVQGG